MRKHVVRFFNTPKFVVIVSLAVSLVVGVYYYRSINKTHSFDLGSASGDILSSSTSPDQDLTLGFLAGGRISAVNVKVGDRVTKGQVLASLDAGNTLGVLTQARASYAQAQAGYQKLINGATGPSIDVAKAALKTAEVNLSEAKDSQDVLVKNAYHNLLNSTPEALPNGAVVDYIPPTISGFYNGDQEGIIKINTYSTGDGMTFSLSGLFSGFGNASTVSPQPLGDSGLYIKFPPTMNTGISSWVINLPNPKAANYLTNYNAYQLALQTRTQTIATLQSVRDQASAALTSLVSAARPEDVASSQAQVSAAQGAIQIAEASYNNTIIRAPSDGVVKSVLIAVGQIAIPNASAIELEVK